jgi:ABC-type transporter Mla MlaB component
MSRVFTMLRSDSTGCPCLSVVGDVGAGAIQPVGDAIHDLVCGAVGFARLDLSTVSAFDASGLAVLSALAEFAAGRGVTLIIDTSPAVRHVLHSAGLS